uniref:Uncharacterized protein n=1 Tax=Caenorhabditis japonica TaxID=281687 RepID=A0A8R1EUL7_CAEJA
MEEEEEEKKKKKKKTIESPSRSSCRKRKLYAQHRTAHINYQGRRSGDPKTANVKMKEKMSIGGMEARDVNKIEDWIAICI